MFVNKDILIMFVNKDLESKLKMIYGWNKNETEVESFTLKALVSDQPRRCCFSYWSLTRLHSRKRPALVFPIPEVVAYESFDCISF